MQKIKDFLLNNKKYVAVGILVAVFIVMLVFLLGMKKDGGSDINNTQETQTEGTTYSVNGKLEKNTNPELITLMENYYSAYAAGDTESIEMIAQPLTENERSYIETFSKYYEDYQNIECYSKPGATEDSYLVSVCYDLKFKDIDTLAPGMDFFYVERDGKGNLCINNIYSAYNFNFMDQELDANLYSMILAYEKSDDVAALQKDVQSRYDEAVKSDEKLANMVGGTLRNAMAKWRESVIGDGEETQSAESTQTTENTQAAQSTESTQAPESTQSESGEEKTSTEESTPKKNSNTTMVETMDICKVRKRPSTDSKILGMVDMGVKLKKTGTKGDWTRVKFQGQNGYIRSDLLKETTESGDEEKTSAESTPKKSNETGTVKTKDICKVRKKPSTDAEVLGMVDIGVKLKKTGTNGDWTRVKFQGQTGYIKSDLLKEVK